MLMFRFSDIFRRYRKAIPGCNRLILFLGTYHYNLNFLKRHVFPDNFLSLWLCSNIISVPFKSSSLTFFIKEVSNFKQAKDICSSKRYLDNCPPRKIAPRLGLGFRLGLGLVLGLAAIFLGGNYPRAVPKVS